MSVAEGKRDYFSFCSEGRLLQGDDIGVENLVK